MSHESQRHFVNLVSVHLPHYFMNQRVLEVGSLNINGSVRDYFQNCRYIGLDVAPGKNVDVVCEGQKYDAPDNAFDVVISCEVMEHNPYWHETFENMVRLCRPGGLIVMTCATIGRPEHGTSKTTPKDSPLTIDIGWDYYRNLTKRDFERKVDLKKLFSTFHFQTNWDSFDLLFFGIKREIQLQEDTFHNLHPLISDIDQYVALANSCKRHSYRSITAKVFGDKYYQLIRRIIWALKYIHND